MVLIMNEIISLCDIRPGQEGVVCEVGTPGAMRRRFFDIGLTRNTLVRCVGRSPSGDPSAYLIRGAVIAIRAEDCRGIRVRAV
jgi:ferrous iron transport protein A